MNTSSINSLKGPFAAPRSGNLKQLVIMLHGYGADGENLFDLSKEFADAFPDAGFLSPNAPEPCEMAPYGYQWFSLQDRTESVMLAGLSRAIPLLEALIESQKKQYGLQDNQIVLLGFSQGTMTALHLALHRSNALAGVIGFSGALISPQTLSAEVKAKPPICLIHGVADPVVPFAAMGIAEEALRQARVSIEAHARPMLPHSIDQQGIQIAREFLKKIF